MDVREAVKDKANYGSIVAYFDSLETLDTDQMVLLIDTIGDMSEEIYEHYRALQDMFRKAVFEVIQRRKQEGSFVFLTPSQQKQLSYAIEKAAALRVLLAEKYEGYHWELMAGKGASA